MRQATTLLLTLVVASVVAVQSAPPAHAQFSTPLPRPMPQDSLLLDYYTQVAYLHLLPDVRRRNSSAQPDISGIEDVIREAARTAVGQDPDAESVWVPRVAARFTARLGGGQKRRVIVRTRPMVIQSLPFRVPLPGVTQERARMIQFLEGTETSTGLTPLSSLAANLTDDTAYITTDVLSGLAGSVIFGLRYATVITKVRGADEATRDTIEGNSAQAIRLVNNGGSVAARFTVPMWARTQTTFAHAVSLVGSAGVIGPLAQPDSLGAALSVSAEWVTSMAIRNSVKGGTLAGSLVAALRVGRAGRIGHDSALSGADAKAVSFAQLGVGVWATGKSGVSVLYTAIDNGSPFRQYVPKFVVNLTALR